MHVFYIPDDRPYVQLIADWCNEIMPWDTNKPRRFQWFPFYNHPVTSEPSVKFIIMNDDDAIAFRLKWNPLAND